VADYINAFMKNFGLKAIVDQTGEKHDCSTRILIVPVNGGGDLILMAHMDTSRPTKNSHPIATENRITSNGTTILGTDNRDVIAIILNILKKFSTNKLSANHSS